MFVCEFTGSDETPKSPISVKAAMALLLASTPPREVLFNALRGKDQRTKVLYIAVLVSDFTFSVCN